MIEQKSPIQGGCLIFSPMEMKNRMRSMRNRMLIDLSGNV